MSSFKINGFNRRIDKSVKFVSDPRNSPKDGVLEAVTNSQGSKLNQMSGSSVKKDTVGAKKQSNSNEFKENQEKIRKYAAEQGGKYQERRNKALKGAIRKGDEKSAEAVLDVLINKSNNQGEEVASETNNLEHISFGVKWALGDKLAPENIVSAIQQTGSTYENVDPSLFHSLHINKKMITKDNVVDILQALKVTKENYDNIDNVLIQCNIERAITPDNVAGVIEVFKTKGDNYKDYPQSIRNKIEDNIIPNNAGDIALALGATSKDDLSVLPKELKVALERNIRVINSKK